MIIENTITDIYLNKDGQPDHQPSKQTVNEFITVYKAMDVYPASEYTRSSDNCKKCLKTCQKTSVFDNVIINHNVIPFICKHMDDEDGSKKKKKTDVVNDSRWTLIEVEEEVIVEEITEIVEENIEVNDG